MTKSLSISQANTSSSIVPVFTRAFSFAASLFRAMPSSFENRLSPYLLWDIGLLDVNPTANLGRKPKAQSQTAVDEMIRRAI